jgi:hypothetical protein
MNVRPNVALSVSGLYDATHKVLEIVGRCDDDRRGGGAVHSVEMGSVEMVR